MTVSAHNRSALTCNAATLNGKYAFYRTGAVARGCVIALLTRSNAAKLAG